MWHRIVRFFCWCGGCNWFYSPDRMRRRCVFCHHEEINTNSPNDLKQNWVSTLS